MPPDGSSAWFKHDDVWTLWEDGAAFASLIASVDGGSAAVTMPIAGSVGSSFFVLRFTNRAGKIVFQLGDAVDELSWLDGITGDALVPAADRRIFPRRDISGALEGAEPIARLEASSSGDIELFDVAGRLRVVISRHMGDLWPSTRKLSACDGAIAFGVPEHPGTVIVRGESSLP